MGKNPIRCGFMCPLRIALTVGQVAHATSGRTLRGRWGLWPFWAKRPKFTQTWSLERSYLHITRDMSLGLLHGCILKLCFPFAARGWGSKHNWSISYTPIFEVHYLWEKVHISAILVCTYLCVIEGEKYE